MRFVITGVAGFIGSNLANRLIKEGHYVVGIDNLSHGSMNNLKKVLGSRSFKFIEGNVQDDDLLETLHFNYDYLVHFASQKIPRYSNSYATLRDNSKMTEKVIDACLKMNAKLVFASTSDVYGKNENIPFTEDSNLVLGRTDVKRWAYAVSKIYSEHNIIANAEAFGLKYTIMRFFSVYGENQDTTWWGGPQGLFIQNIIDDKPIEIHGTGLQTRSFTYIDDNIDGIMHCIFHEKSLNQLFNIGNPHSYTSIGNLANIIMDIMGKTVPIVDIPYSNFGKYEDVMVRLPEIGKIKAMLGFNPRWSLYDGLTKTIEWQIKQQ